MKVTVQYTTQLKAAIGRPEETLELSEDATVEDLISNLRTRHPQVTQELLVDSAGSLLPSIIICVNGQQVDPHRHIALPHEAMVTLLSAISGG